MKTKRILTISLLGLGLASVPGASAQAIKTWTVQDGDFLNPANWQGGVPGSSDITDLAEISNGGTATIGANAGTLTFGGVRLGPTQGSSESGHIVMQGGTLNLSGTPGDPKALIGNSDELSTFIMNGGTIFFDGPDQGFLSDNFKGVNELDWEVGEKGFGRFEMHGNSQFFASDDLKVAENVAGHGETIIDGSAHLAVGSGISISGGGAGAEEVMTIGGNAIVDSGNSMGAGDPRGGTDEGYLTMASGGGISRLTIQDNGVLNIRRLTAREGSSTIVVKDRGQFHIFDVLNGKGGSAANRPAEMGPNSTYVSAAGTGTLTLQDDAQMTVNSAPLNGPTQGLGISAQRDSGNAGGTAVLTIRDRASLRVEQDLMLGTGADSTTTDGTLEIVGGDASVSIGANLDMAVDLFGLVSTFDGLPGKSTLSEVFTGPTQTAVNVEGIARIANGQLKVKLEGYSPASGTTYTLIKGGTIEGEFASTDFTEAELEEGLSWEVEYKQDAVNLKVTGQAVGGRTLVVTTADNVNPPGGSLSLLQAMGMLQKGDTITFNIPGSGPHVIATPMGGYPLITAHNVTIDGYSQPGSSPNTNPILAANNAKIDIVLDSRNGNFRLMDFPGDNPNDSTGYGDTEAATIGILSATNVTIRGLSIVSIPLAPGASPNFEDVGVYGISFAKGAQGHVSGCWIGVAPDGTTVAGPADAITGFRYRVRDANNTVTDNILANNIVIGVGVKSTNAPAEFNVILGIPAIPIIIEGEGTRISGNFLNVYPSGLRDFNPPLVNPDLFIGTFEGNIEIGRAGNNTVIGVDGDGVNDANERNVFSGVVPPFLGGYDHNIEFYGQTPGTNVVVAGNYIGVGVDGTTRFTNAVPALNAAGGSAQYRFGSDFNGVSDALEGNVVFNNWPADVQDFVSGAEGFFDELSTGAIVGARGNKMVNNFTFPVSPIRAAGDFTFYESYYMKALVDPLLGTIPVLSTNTSRTRLVGTAPVNNMDYPTLVIDLYEADPEGIEFGVNAQIPELPKGFIQGRTYIGSVVDNSAADANKNPGEFDVDISAWPVTGTNLTVTANYSMTAAGTTNGVYLTSPFSDPVPIQNAPTVLVSIAKMGSGMVRLTWQGGSAPYIVQKKNALSDATWTEVTTTSGTSADVASSGAAGFFRIATQ